ncbi:hypothetical protein [Curtobacterium sp. MCPF17_003]|uniref:hypothetical protein n=1 Tax=Curtobacterium sp. MCPF17_003 TaxID=2175637 RepID=UPI0011B72A6C|nr:hypothetical protein [Curtobacterium sp. MCPF17_003]
MTVCTRGSLHRAISQVLAVAVSGLILSGCAQASNTGAVTPSKTQEPSAAASTDEAPVLTAPSSSARPTTTMESALLALEQTERATVSTCVMSGATGALSTYKGEAEVPADVLLAAVLPAIAARNDPSVTTLPVAQDRSGVDAQIRRLGGDSSVAAGLAALNDRLTTTRTTTARQACSDINTALLGDLLNEPVNSTYREALLTAASRETARSFRASVPDGSTTAGTVLVNGSAAGAVAVLSGVHWSTVITVFVTGAADPLAVVTRATQIALTT